MAIDFLAPDVPRTEAHPRNKPIIAEFSQLHFIQGRLCAWLACRVNDLADVSMVDYCCRMRVAIQNSPTGRGVFAIASVAAGETILNYTGPLLTYAQTSPETLAVQIGPDRYLGASGNADDFVNHSCDPNSGLLIDGLDVRLIAIKAIEPGEQITFDYSTTMDEDDFEFDCLCGSNLCRGRVGDFKHLSADLKKRYAALGIVPEYNLQYVMR